MILRSLIYNDLLMVQYATKATKGEIPCERCYLGVQVKGDVRIL